jgi:hypothetical protein
MSWLVFSMSFLFPLLVFALIVLDHIGPVVLSRRTVKSDSLRRDRPKGGVL